MTNQTAFPVIDEADIITQDNLLHGYGYDHNRRNELTPSEREAREKQRLIKENEKAQKALDELFERLFSSHWEVSQERILRWGEEVPYSYRFTAITDQEPNQRPAFVVEKMHPLIAQHILEVHEYKIDEKERIADTAKLSDAKGPSEVATLRMPPDELKVLQLLAQMRKESFSSMVRQILKETLLKDPQALMIFETIKKEAEKKGLVG